MIPKILLSLYLVLFIAAFPVIAENIQEINETAKAESAARFFVSIQDMPLMPGLHELQDQTVIFDKPQGRIIESVAEIEPPSLLQSEIILFYEQALPQLGWTRISENAFIREDEFLRLSFENYQGQNFFRIMVSPR